MFEKSIPALDSSAGNDSPFLKSFFGLVIHDNLMQLIVKYLIWQWLLYHSNYDFNKGCLLCVLGLCRLQKHKTKRNKKGSPKFVVGIATLLRDKLYLVFLFMEALQSVCSVP